MNNNSKVNYFRVLTGGYLFVMAYKILYAVFDGTAQMPWLNILSGLGFVAFGGWLILLEWKNYNTPAEETEEEPEAEGAGETPDEETGALTDGDPAADGAALDAPAEDVDPIAEDVGPDHDAAPDACEHDPDAPAEAAENAPAEESAHD